MIAKAARLESKLAICIWATIFLPQVGGGATLDPWDYIVPGSEDEKYCDIACGKTEINDFMFKDFNRDNVGEMLLALSNVYAIAPIVPKKNQQK